MEYQMLQQQVQQIQQSIKTTADQLIEIEYMKSSLEEFSSAEPGKDMLCPIGSGIFVKASVKDNQSFFVNVGDNVVARKDLTQVKELLDSQLKAIEETRAKLMENFNLLASRMQGLEHEFMGAE